MDADYHWPTRALMMEVDSPSQREMLQSQYEQMVKAHVLHALKVGLGPVWLLFAAGWLAHFVRSAIKSERRDWS